MKFTGILKPPIIDYITGRPAILFEPEQDFRQAYEELKDCGKLSLEIKKYRAGRSLNANAYFHVLNGKIAEELGISKPRCKNILIGRYGQPELLDDGSEAVLKTNVPVSKMLEQESLHCYPCGSKRENGMELTFYKIKRGSHTYNTKEMGVLIDGAVSEAKDIGIPDAEIATPDERRILKERYGLEI